jgi:two-component system LytT family sensor kinase
MHARAALFTDDREFLEWAFQQLGQFMSADRVQEVAAPVLADSLGGEDLFFPAPASDISGLRDSAEFNWVEAVAPIRLAREEVRYLLLGRRRGGRRYLSEDLQSLSRIVAVIAQEVERFRNSEMQRLVSQAELRALQSQINPHFLFNALNTLYGIIPRGASGARKTVLNLAEIFRYCLQSEKAFIPLSDELRIVNAYLDIERLRLGPRLETQIEIDENALPVLIPILCIQPLVENAIKHGVSTKAEPGLLRLQAKMRDDEVLITVQDTGPGMSGRVPGTRVGVGLANVKRRLRLCYGPDADLLIESSGEGTRVQFAVPLLAQVDGV